MNHHELEKLWAVVLFMRSHCMTYLEFPQVILERQKSNYLPSASLQVQARWVMSCLSVFPQKLYRETVLHSTS